MLTCWTLFNCAERKNVFGEEIRNYWICLIVQNTNKIDLRSKDKMGAGFVSLRKTLIFALKTEMLYVQIGCWGA